MAAVLLDTTVVIDLLRGRPDAIRRLRRLRDSGDQPYVCAINVEETARGLRSARRKGGVPASGVETSPPVGGRFHRRTA